MNSYYQEIVRIGIKYNINSNLIKEIYEYNNGNYPNHIDMIIKNEYNIQFNLKECHLSKSYFNDICRYCDEEINCEKCNNKYARHIDHAHCDRCKLCINNAKKHFYCNKCKKCCDEINHKRCEKCNQYGDINLHKYHDSNLIINTSDMVLAYHLNLNLGINRMLSIEERRDYIIIALRLSIFLVKNTEKFNVIHFKTAIINKLEEFINNPKFTINQQVLLYKYKTVLENM